MNKWKYKFTYNTAVSYSDLTKYECRLTYWNWSKLDDCRQDIADTFYSCDRNIQCSSIYFFMISVFVSVKQDLPYQVFQLNNILNLLKDGSLMSGAVILLLVLLPVVERWIKMRDLWRSNIHTVDHIVYVYGRGNLTIFKMEIRCKKFISSTESTCSMHIWIHVSVINLKNII